MSVPVEVSALPAADRRAAVLASLSGLGVTTAAVAEVKPDSLRPSVNSPAYLSSPSVEQVAMCRASGPHYDDYGYSDGETYRCGLREGHKGAHSKGERV